MKVTKKIVTTDHLVHFWRDTVLVLLVIQCIPYTDSNNPGHPLKGCYKTPSYIVLYTQNLGSLRRQHYSHLYSAIQYCIAFIFT